MRKLVARLYNNNRILFITSCVTVLFLLLVFFVFDISGSKLTTLAVNAAILGIIALGQTFVMLVAGIDFSVQWLLCAAAISVSNIYVGSILALAEVPLLLILLIVLVCCTLVGCINGVGVAYFGINPMIVTFSMNELIHGVMLAWTNGISGRFMPPEIKDFLNQSWGPVPIMVYIWLLLIAVATFMLNCTSFGRKIYAVGKNPQTAYFSGIRVRRIRMFAYCISGFMAGLGGILMAAGIGRSYLGMGDNTVIQSILAVVIGGATISYGNGSYTGTVVGVISLTALMFIMSELNIPAGIQHTALGVILMAVIVATGSRKRKHADRETIAP